MGLCTTASGVIITPLMLQRLHSQVFATINQCLEFPSDVWRVWCPLSTVRPYPDPVCGHEILSHRSIYITFLSCVGFSTPAAGRFLCVISGTEHFSGVELVTGRNPQQNCAGSVKGVPSMKPGRLNCGLDSSYRVHIYRE